MGENIKRLRELKGWKQLELANKVGVTQPTVAAWAGHSSWETTKTYTHVVFLEKKKPAK